MFRADAGMNHEAMHPKIKAAQVLRDANERREHTKPWTRALAVFSAQETDGSITVLARGSGYRERTRHYEEGPRGFTAWLDGDRAPEQSLMNAPGAPLDLRNAPINTEASR